MLRFALLLLWFIPHVVKNPRFSKPAKGLLIVLGILLGYLVYAIYWLENWYHNKKAA